MPSPRILRKLARHLRPFVQERVDAALAETQLRLDDEDAIDALGRHIARQIDDAVDLRGIPVVGEALEAIDGIVLQAMVAAALDEAVERAEAATVALRANRKMHSDRVKHRAEYGI